MTRLRECSLLVLVVAAGTTLLAATAQGQAVEKGLVGRWVFARLHVSGKKVKDLAGGRDATILGPVKLARQPEALILDGKTNSLTISHDIALSKLPKREITAEAWVAIDTPIEWGGIIGYFQDNGSFEKGWLLGYRRSSFSFALSSAGADDGDGKLTYLNAASSLEPGRWYHVAGTYDGAVLKIYVNGRLESSSKAQSGDINYPKRAFYDIGAYHDSNEFFRCHGMIHEVRVYDRALSAAELLAHYKAKKPLFPQPLHIVAGPYLRRVAPDTVTLTWRMAGPGTALVEYGEAMPLTRQIRDDSAGTIKRVTLAGLRAETVYHYRIRWTGAAGAKRPAAQGFSRVYRFDTTFNPSPPPLPQGPSPYPKDSLTPLYAHAATQIIEKTGVKKGFCLVLGCGEGRLAYELARRTELKIVGIEQDASKVTAARKALDRAGAYGVRVSVHSGSLSKLPFPSYFANLIVSDEMMTSGEVTGDVAEVFRVLRPCGGVAYLGQSAGFAARGRKLSRSKLGSWLKRSAVPGWKVTDENGLWAMSRRGQLPGSGEWTHMYADPGNSACSGDERVRGPMQIQWFGRPGPRLMIDRHHRTVPPLFRDGRLFIPAEDRIVAVDAYNGTQLWDVMLPDSTRLGAPKDSGYMALSDDILYVATLNECVGLDVATGRTVLSFPTPQLSQGDPRYWGYIATEGNLLFGSGRKKGASLRQQGRTVVEIQYGDFKNISTSDYLFCLDRRSGKTLWTYQSGVIIDPAIAVGGGRIYCLESTNPKAAEDSDGRMKLDVLLGKGSRLVALHAQNGKTTWNKPVDLRALQHVIHLSYARGTVLVLGAKNKQKTVWYDLFAFDARTGEPLWHREQNNRCKTGGDHGEQVKHPAIVADVVHAEPFAYSLRTGEPVAGWKFNRGGHGCGTISASASCLFYRAGNPTMFDLRTRKASKLTHVNRPGCWINIIPAGGMVLIPEASSGCTCGFSLQSSFVFLPKEVD